MPSLREFIKRALPPATRQAVVRARDWLSAPPLETIALHDYDLAPDPTPGRRLTLVLPSVAPALAFGGIVTGLELVAGIARRGDAGLRLVLDDFGPVTDRVVVDRAARAAGLDPARITLEPRTGWIPKLTVRPGDVFMAFHTWIALNLLPALRFQSTTFGGVERPLLYPIQEYEPLFYPMSSTHMLARAAFDLSWPCWALFNSRELHAFFVAQGHRVTRAYVFEPKLAEPLRAHLADPPPTKQRRILVYGRPNIPRNCFPAVVAGLRAWIEPSPRNVAWEVVSAGLAHRPIPLGKSVSMRSLGKLTMDEYGRVLRESAVGLALMASPHPSYPPLEMAHFGVRTITNRYGPFKDLSASHRNIVSIPDIMPGTIAAALTGACAAFEAAPMAGWHAETTRPSFLESTPPACLDEIAAALIAEVWT